MFTALWWKCHKDLAPTEEILSKNIKAYSNYGQYQRKHETERIFHFTLINLGLKVRVVDAGRQHLGLKDYMKIYS